MTNQEIQDTFFSAVMQRLVLASGSRSERELAIRMGFKPNAYYNRKVNGSLPHEEIIAICREKQISLDWLYGIGEQEGSAAGVQMIAPALLSQIMCELEAGLSGEDGLATIEHAGKLGLLAAGIYNKVRQSPDQSRAYLEQLIRAEAKAYSEAANLLATK